ncbi:MAG: hypothetical protein PUB09_01440 [Firmicutes bacterium]|nr:hypothetical protein [Bacillota bacterium]
MKKTRLLPLLIIVVMTISLTMSGCSADINRDQELKEAHDNIYKEVTETFNQESLDFTLLSEYLESWAINCDMEVDENADHYIVITNPATEDCKKEESTALQCSVDTNNCENSLYVLSSGMTALLGPLKHGDISLIVTEIADGQRIGAQSLLAKHLKKDNVIGLINASNQSVYTEGAYGASGTITAKAKKVSPKYSECYTITMAMPEYTDPYSFDKKKNYPNPIETIGGLLATTKSSGKLFEIADFSCQAHEGYTPYTATATIVVDSNNVESIKKKFDKSYETMENRFEKLDSEFVYTMDKSKMPGKVLSEKSSNNLISLMYTLNTGNCIQDEESGLVYATSYIDSISTKNSKLNLSLKVRTRGEEYLDDVSEMYEITAGLCSTQYKQESKGRIWASSEKSGLAPFFSSMIPSEEGSSEIALKSYDNDYFYAKYNDINMISVLFSKSDRSSTIFTITHFIDPDYEKNTMNY